MNNSAGTGFTVYGSIPWNPHLIDGQLVQAVLDAAQGVGHPHALLPVELMVLQLGLHVAELLKSLVRAFDGNPDMTAWQDPHLPMPDGPTRRTIMDLSLLTPLTEE
jgi:hypothetical protein